MTSQLTSFRVKHSNTTKAFFIIAALLLIAVAGCRYNVGADFGAYYRGYYTYLDLLPSIKSLDEPGIRFIYWIAVRLHDTGGMCILAVAAVTLGLELSTIYKNTNNIGFSLALFTFTCWTACFNGVRQALAAAVLFCGLPALRDKKFWKYAIIVFLAFLCHRSAAIMILVYFMVDRKADTKNVILLVVLTIVVLYSYDKVYSVINVVMDNDITGAESYWSTSVNRLRILTDIAPAAFFLYKYRNVKKTPTVSFYLNLLVTHAVVGVTTSNSACLARMVMYTMPFAVVAMAELIKPFPKKSRRTWTWIILGLFLFMQFYECSNSGSLNPFQLRWFW